LPETRVINYYLIYSETSHWPTSFLLIVWEVWVYLHSIFLQWAPKDIFSAIECVSTVQVHPRSIILVFIESAYATSQVPTNPLLYYSPTLHRFWDTATYWLNIAYLSYSSLIRCSRSLCSLWNFVWVMGLSYSEDRMIVAGVILTWYRTVTDG